MTNAESNVHVKVAMADVLGLLAISMFTMSVAAFGLGASKTIDMLTLVAAIGPYVGIATLIAAVFAYLNENLLGTAIFGPLAVFFFALVLLPLSPAGFTSASMLCLTIGIIILIDAIVSFAQPVKLLPILLLIGAISFFVTALFYNSLLTGDWGLQSAVGALWLIFSLVAFYMAAAIMVLVMKGKPMLPLLIKA
jgi:succinate-acetate transporter protein